jgi:DNA processing protein
VLLWARGDASVLSEPSLAVVGARACSSYGTYVTADLTSDACASGLAIVSGAAYGVDAVAHRAALAASARTVAVLAGGVDRPYPSAHGPLIEQIASTGVICSEVVPGTAPTRWRFLQRNRIIASLAQATLVTEAGPRSGSLNTAGHAAEIGRPLGAVPGPVTNPASLGCHRLIREYGATLVSSGADLRELVGLQDFAVLEGLASAGSEQPRESALHRRVIDALPLRGSRAAGDVARIAGMTFDDARAALAELELLGQVVRRETPHVSEPHWSLLRRE